MADRRDILENLKLKIKKKLLLNRNWNCLEPIWFRFQIQQDQKGPRSKADHCTKNSMQVNFISNCIHGALSSFFSYISWSRWIVTLCQQELMIGLFITGWAFYVLQRKTVRSFRCRTTRCERLPAKNNWLLLWCCL